MVGGRGRENEVMWAEEGEVRVGFGCFGYCSVLVVSVVVFVVLFV